MATKTISITEESYERLKSIKNSSESFSEVIERITAKGSLLKLAGILSLDSGKRLEKSILEGRKMSRNRRERMLRDI